MDTCLQNYRNGANFVNAFSPSLLDRYLEDRDRMITTTKAPTLTISKLAFGSATVKMLISQHLFELSKAFGITSTAETIDAIVSDILSGYGYLKISELLLALKMMREGKLRDGRDGSSNRAAMYGTLSSETICDCINRFVYEHRNKVLDKVSEEEKIRKREEEIRNMATPEERRNVLVAVYVTCPGSRIYINNIATKEDMDAIQQVVKELAAYRLLKTRVEEFLMTVNEETKEIESLRKGVNYINENFSQE